MSALLSIVLVLLLVIGLVVGMAVLALALGARSVTRANRVVPAVPTHAPTLWRWSAGYGARLHRRLQRVAALARAAGGASSAVAELADDLQHQACALDDQVALARHLPGGQRARRLFALERHLAELEQVGLRVSTLAGQLSGGLDPRGVAPLAERVQHLEEAVAEVRRIEAEALGEARALTPGAESWVPPGLGTPVAPKANVRRR